MPAISPVALVLVPKSRSCCRGVNPTLGRVTRALITNVADEVLQVVGRAGVLNASPAEPGFRATTAPAVGFTPQQEVGGHIA